jgi:hypothetical protein
MKEVGCLNSSADKILRKNETWSDTNLTCEYDHVKPGFVFTRLICTCGNLVFEILQTDLYETAGRCTACGKYYLVHCG